MRRAQWQNCRLARYTTVMPASPIPPNAIPAQRLTVRALLLGDRIDTTGLERSEMISTVPFAFRTGEAGFVVLFRYGVAVFGGLSPLEEEDELKMLAPRIASLSCVLRCRWRCRSRAWSLPATDQRFRSGLTHAVRRWLMTYRS